VMATEKGNGLPRGWARATIVDLIAPDGLFVDGDWVESKDQDPNGSVRLIQLADVGDGEYRNRSSRFLTSAKAKELGCTYLKADDAVIARMPDPLGRCCLFPGDAKPSVTVVDVCIIRTGDLGANHRWLMYAVNSPRFRAEIASHQSGSTRKRISRSNLAKLHLPVPPLPEQYRIVAKIEELLTRLDAGVRALNAIKTQLKRYRQSVLKSAFEGKLTAEWREVHKGELEPASVLLERIKQERKKKLGNKYRESPPVDASELPELPEGWVWTTTGNVCSSVRDGTHDTPKYHREGIPLVTSKNLRDGVIDFSTTRNISLEDHEKIKIRSGVDPGDILFAMIGTVGNPVVVRTERLFSIKNVGLFKKDEKAFVPEFVKYWFDSPVFTKALQEKYVKGTTQKFVPLENLRMLPVALCSLSEQQQIVLEIERCFSVTDAIERAVQQSVTQSERLRQSILKRAFEGKLVPQDPSNEPAERLLERIKAERERMAEKGAKGRGIGKARRGAKLGN